MGEHYVCLNGPLKGLNFQERFRNQGDSEEHNLGVSDIQV